jgi:hypothetical protein
MAPFCFHSGYAFARQVQLDANAAKLSESLRVAAGMTPDIGFVAAKASLGIAHVISPTQLCDVEDFAAPPIGGQFI